MFGLFKKLFCKKEVIPTPQGPNPKLALKVIKKAKKEFKCCGLMCPSMIEAYRSEVNEDACMQDVRDLIPEFNPKFLGGEDALFWWNPTDRKPRIKAFNTLIKIYSKKV